MDEGASCEGDPPGENPPGDREEMGVEKKATGPSCGGEVQKTQDGPRDGLGVHPQLQQQRQH